MKIRIKSCLHECRVLEYLFKKTFEFLKGLCLPHITWEFVPQNGATIAKGIFIIICPW